MAAFFIVTVIIPDPGQRQSYDEYIQQVKPIVESHGGVYLLRSERVFPFTGPAKPDRVIIIRFDSRQQLDECFASPEYAAVKQLRKTSVQASAFVVEE